MWGGIARSQNWLVQGQCASWGTPFVYSDISITDAYVIVSRDVSLPNGSTITISPSVCRYDWHDVDCCVCAYRQILPVISSGINMYSKYVPIKIAISRDFNKLMISHNNTSFPCVQYLVQMQSRFFFFGVFVMPRCGIFHLQIWKW